MFGDFAKYSKDLKQVIKNMRKYASRKVVQQWGARIAPWIPAAAGLGYMGSRAFIKRD